MRGGNSDDQETSRAWSLLYRVVRSFARDHHVMHVALAQPSRADADETRALLKLGDRLASAIAHARLQPAHHLVDDQRNRAAIRYAAFNALGHKLAKAVRFFSEHWN